MTQPLVSILTNCKNGERYLRKCMDSVLAQTCPDIEYVFQDGGSTDGTLGIVGDYQARFPGRIVLESKPDKGPEEGFYRALRRCRGRIIGSCMADEELLPHAAQWAVDAFLAHPECGAIYGDYHLLDQAGGVLKRCSGGDFSLQRYLLHEVTPPFPASFFRRECLLPVIHRPGIGETRIGEFELWLRLAMEHPILHVPEVVTRFADHPGRDTVQKAHYALWISGRKAFLEQFLAEAETPEEVRALKGQALGGLMLWAAQNLLQIKAFPEARAALEGALEHEPNPGRFLTLLEWWHHAYNGHLHGELEGCTRFREHATGYLAHLDCPIACPPPKPAAGSGGVRRILWIREADGAEEALAAHLLERIREAFPEAHIMPLVPSAQLEGYPRLCGLMPYDPARAETDPEYRESLLQGTIRAEPDVLVQVGEGGTALGDLLDQAALIPVKARFGLSPFPGVRRIELSAALYAGIVPGVEAVLRQIVHEGFPGDTR